MEIKIKTVWHWKEIVKTMLVVFAIVAIVLFMDLNPYLTFITSAAIGTCGGLLGMRYWKFYHFETYIVKNGRREKHMYRIDKDEYL